MDLQLKDKVVLVSGGAKGIGAAIVKALAQEGAAPVIVDRDAAAARALESELRDAGGKTFSVIADIAEAEDCRQAVDQTTTKLGQLDALVNNAGVNDRVGLENGSPEKFTASLKQNLLHYYNLTHFALPALKQSRGCIVNIASKTAVTGQGGTSG